MGSLIFLVLLFAVLIFLITGKGVHPDSKPGRSRLSVTLHYIKIMPVGK